MRNTTTFAAERLFASLAKVITIFAILNVAAWHLTWQVMKCRGLDALAIASRNARQHPSSP